MGSDADLLIPLIGFEDAGELLLSNFNVAWAFLEGKWSCSSGSLEFDADLGLTFSLSAPDFGDKWGIENGLLYFYDSDNPATTKSVYQLSVASVDEMSCYAYRNGSTYTLRRR